MGIPAQTINDITDPGAVKILHMAMQFHKGKSKVVVTKKVNKTPTKIVKNTAASPAARGTPTQVTAKTAVSKAKRTGAMEDAVNAFEALMGDD
jgi:ribonuclease D